MEQCFQTSKEVEELQKLQLHKHHRSIDKYQNVSAKVTSFRDKKKHESNNADRVSIDKVEVDEQVQNETNVFDDKKHAASVKKIGPGTNNNISGRQKRTSKHKSQQKLQPKVLSELNILHKSDNAANDLDTQSTVRYRSQGIQTLDTDQLESIYSEGIIR